MMGCALPGRAERMEVSKTHYVLKTPMQGPWPSNMKARASVVGSLSSREVCVMANGCFWGSEKGFWRLPGGGVYSTAVGYAAGRTPNPTYEDSISSKAWKTSAGMLLRAHWGH